MGLMEEGGPVIWRPTATTSGPVATVGAPNIAVASLHTRINEEVVDDSTYVGTGDSTSNGYVEFTMGGGNFGTGASAVLKLRLRRYTNFPTLNVTLGAKTFSAITPTTSFLDYELSLTAAEIAAWNIPSLKLRFTTLGFSGNRQIDISYVSLTITQA